jgi:hypothetical protein
MVTESQIVVSIIGGLGLFVTLLTLINGFKFQGQ